MEIKSSIVHTKDNLGSSVHRFSMQASSTAFDILSRDMYTNPLEAVVRELICNAIDSHKALGTSAPVVVTLPTVNDAYFVVEDQGTGMEFDALETLMSTYFSSTKRDDNGQIGGFGIGSKAPFAYTDTFNIRARYNGVEKVYVAYKEADGPVLRAMGNPRSTSEPNGIRVSIPVRDVDFQRFISAYHKVAFFLPKGAITPAPTVHFTDHLTEVVEGVWIDASDNAEFMASFRDHAECDDIYSMFRNARGPIVSMGGVGYSTEDFSMGKFDRLGARLITVDIGVFAPHPSREVLTPTDGSKAHMVKLLAATTEVLTKDLVESLESSSSSIFEKQQASTKYQNITGYTHSSAHYSVEDTLLEDVLPPNRFFTWNFKPAGGGTKASNRQRNWTDSRAIRVMGKGTKVVVCGARSINADVLDYNNLCATTSNSGPLIIYVRHKFTGTTEGLNRTPPSRDWVNAKERNSVVDKAVNYYRDLLNLSPKDIVSYHSLPRRPREAVEARVKEGLISLRKPTQVLDLVSGQKTDLAPDTKCFFVVTSNGSIVDGEATTRSPADITAVLSHPFMAPRITKKFPNTRFVAVPKSIKSKFDKNHPNAESLWGALNKEIQTISPMVTKAKSRGIYVDKWKDASSSAVLDFVRNSKDGVIALPEAKDILPLTKGFDGIDKELIRAIRDYGVKLEEGNNSPYEKVLRNIQAHSDWWSLRIDFLLDISMPSMYGGYGYITSDFTTRRKKARDFLQTAVLEEINRHVADYTKFKAERKII